MTVTRRLVEFERHDTAEVEALLASLPDGAWVNVEPIVDDDDLQDLRQSTPHPLLRVFSAKGRPIPFATVVAQQDALAVGLEHSRGARVAPELRELGLSAPPSWRQQQDHAKRGIVYAVPREESAHIILEWILSAATALSAVPIRGRWSAMVAVP
jgi:hypothetical protein